MRGSERAAFRPARLRVSFQGQNSVFLKIRIDLLLLAADSCRYSYCKEFAGSENCACVGLTTSQMAALLTSVRCEPDMRKK